MKNLSVGDLVIVPGCRFATITAINSETVTVSVVTEYNDIAEEIYPINKVAKV